MNILAIDCCLKLTGVALMLDDKIFITQKDLGRRQSGELPIMTGKILSENNISFNELDYIALTNGPGYFTGIRVGAAYASGLAYASGAKIITVSTLEMLAHKIEDEKILTLIYAGHGFVYAKSKNLLDAGEYSHEFIKEWLGRNPDAKIISDDPERLELNELKILQVKPDLISLCETAKNNLQQAINPLELKISYYRAPQGAEKAIRN
ncbi:MAG: tRNA (adenosine(37)-N6)-threonylcarbamoyltransferase complex dimerization subunit type 1 TsaB [Synergistaceae bacterium]|nr:tRNA (adenosine(37)-N6)-threonylcarbamoyltransferase complex dimerization subunit type 1 TsaB [Synergistaceae bacterium]